MTRWIEAYIPLLRCDACHEVTAHLVFSADTDMVTPGLEALSSAIRDEIVVADLALADRSEAAAHVNALLGRDDLRVVPLLRAEGDHIPAGLSFEEFMARYRPPRLIYGCPKCGTGEARVVQEIGPSDYLRTGGTLTVLPDIEIRDCQSKRPRNRFRGLFVFRDPQDQPS